LSEALQDALELVRSAHTLALSTTGEDGAPRIAPLFYIADEHLRLYWFSEPRSEHSRNLKRDPRAGVTVFRETSRWQEIRGAQLRGRVAVVGRRALRKAMGEEFSRRFGLGVAFYAVMARCRLYCFEPEWVRVIDNSRGFGFKSEWSLPRTPQNTA
jgi:uncharacterized protein